MMLWQNLWIVLTISSFHGICSAPIEQPVNYDGHSVIRVYFEDEKHQSRFADIQYNPAYRVDVWQYIPSISAVDLQIPPDTYAEVTQSIRDAGMTFTVMIKDLQQLIDKEKTDDVQHSSRRRRRDALMWTSIANDDELPLLFYWFNVVGRYAGFDEINDWIQFAVHTKPEIANISDIGTTYEGRQMKVLKIGKPGPDKPAIWIDAGTHAREWISVSTIVYFIYKLIHEYGNDTTVTSLVDTFDWYLLPVANPDGYEYSHTYNRMWRKTRSHNEANGCDGVDMNRNFGYKWMSHCSRARLCPSRNPCEVTYAGSAPFSEPETRAMAQFIMEHRNNIKLYLSLHSYSQMWLTPWGYTKEPPSDYSELRRMALLGAAALKRMYGTVYVVGSPANLLYEAGGGSYDWAHGVAGIQYSYTVELRDHGMYGFVLPKHMIIPTGEETWMGVSTVALELKRLLEDDGSAEETGGAQNAEQPQNQLSATESNTYRTIGNSSTDEVGNPLVKLMGEHETRDAQPANQ